VDYVIAVLVGVLTAVAIIIVKESGRG